MINPPRIGPIGGCAKGGGAPRGTDINVWVEGCLTNADGPVATDPFGPFKIVTWPAALSIDTGGFVKIANTGIQVPNTGYYNLRLYLWFATVGHPGTARAFFQLRVNGITVQMTTISQNFGGLGSFGFIYVTTLANSVYMGAGSIVEAWVQLVNNAGIGGFGTPQSLLDVMQVAS